VNFSPSLQISEFGGRQNFFSSPQTLDQVYATALDHAARAVTDEADMITSNAVSIIRRQLLLLQQHHVKYQVSHRTEVISRRRITVRM